MGASRKEEGKTNNNNKLINNIEKGKPETEEEEIVRFLLLFLSLACLTAIVYFVFCCM